MLRWPCKGVSHSVGVTFVHLMAESLGGFSEEAANMIRIQSFRGGGGGHIIAYIYIPVQTFSGRVLHIYGCPLSTHSFRIGGNI